MQIQSWIHEAAYINGEWVTSESGEQVAVTNPADGATLGHVPALSAQQVASAIEAANVALPAWKSIALFDR